MKSQRLETGPAKLLVKGEQGSVFLRSVPWLIPFPLDFQYQAIQELLWSNALFKICRKKASQKEKIWSLLKVVTIWQEKEDLRKSNHKTFIQKKWQQKVSKKVVIKLLSSTHCCYCLVAKSCLTLCHPVECSLPGSSAHRILQARILEWVAISFFRGSSWPRNQTLITCLAGRFFSSQLITEIEIFL